MNTGDRFCTNYLDNFSWDIANSLWIPSMVLKPVQNCIGTAEPARIHGFSRLQLNFSRLVHFYLEYFFFLTLQYCIGFAVFETMCSLMHILSSDFSLSTCHSDWNGSIRHSVLGHTAYLLKGKNKYPNISYIFSYNQCSPIRFPLIM